MNKEMKISKYRSKAIFDMYRRFTSKGSLDYALFMFMGNLEDFKPEISENINKPHDNLIIWKRLKNI